MEMEAWLSQMGQEPSLSAAFSFGSEVKAYACNVGDLGSIPGSGRSPGEGSGTPLQYSCLENPMEGGAWGATVHGVAKSRTRLCNFTFTLALSKWHPRYCRKGGQSTAVRHQRTIS